VHAVTELLRRHGINIEDMDTETASAPWTGAPMFRMRAHLVIPQGVSIAELRHELGAVEAERDLDIALKPVGAAGVDT
jgi:glycine cleavage system transcriptional repressor